MWMGAEVQTRVHLDVGDGELHVDVEEGALHEEEPARGRRPDALLDDLEAPLGGGEDGAVHEARVVINEFLRMRLVHGLVTALHLVRACVGGLCHEVHTSTQVQPSAGWLGLRC